MNNMKRIMVRCALSQALLISTLVAHIGASFNFEEVERAIYDVSLDGEPFSAQEVLNARRAHGDQLPLEEAYPELPESSSLVLANEYGQKFVCDIPDASSGYERERTAADFGNFTVDNVTDLIGVAFSLRPCLKKTIAWWTYEVCYGREVKQYHLSGRDIVGDIVHLGYFNRNLELPDLTVRRRTQLHFSQMYDGGTLCELSSQLRKAEVRYFCDDELGSTDAFIYRVDEPATCQYELTVHVGSLCALKAFAPVDQPAPPQAVVCRPLLAPDQAAAYAQKKVDLERKVADQKERERREEERKRQESELERRRLRAKQPRPGKERAAQVDSLVDQYRSMMETAVQKQASALGEDPAAFQVVNFDLNLFGDPAEAEDDETEEDVKRGDLWYYFNDKRWHKKDFPSYGALADDADDSDEIDEFERQLMQISSGALSGMDKKMLKDKMMEEFDEIIAEGKEEVPVEDEERADRDSVATLQKTLAKLLDSLEKTEQKVKGSVQSSPPPAVEAASAADQAGVDEATVADQPGGTDGRVKVRVRKVDSSAVEDYNVRKKVNSETQRLEEQLTERLKKAGFNANGHKVQVKVITSGYYDEQKEEFHVLSAEESEQFSNLIVSMLGGDNEQNKEKTRQQMMELNYAFSWRGGGDGDDENEQMAD